MKRVVSNIVVFPTANSLERLIEYVSSMNTHPFTDYYNNPCANTASILKENDYFVNENNFFDFEYL